jgi:hypothetical protein
MFRRFAKQTAVLSSRGGVLRAAHQQQPRLFSTAAAPSVKDILIDLTFVDPSGARRKAKGMIGTCIIYLVVNYCGAWLQHIKT